MPGQRPGLGRDRHRTQKCETGRRIGACATPETRKSDEVARLSSEEYGIERGVAAFGPTATHGGRNVPCGTP